MRLSDFKDDDALDVLADILEPAAEILADEEIERMRNAKTNRIKIIAYAIKNHKRAVIEILARLDNTPVEDYHVNAVTLPIQLLTLVNDPEVQILFTSQGQNSGVTSSGSAMVSTEEKES